MKHDPKTFFISDVFGTAMNTFQVIREKKNQVIATYNLYIYILRQFSLNVRWDSMDSMPMYTNIYIYCCQHSENYIMIIYNYISIDC